VQRQVAPGVGADDPGGGGFVGCWGDRRDAMAVTGRGDDVSLCWIRSDRFRGAADGASADQTGWRREQKVDKAGVIVFGTDASIDRCRMKKIDLQKIARWWTRRYGSGVGLPARDGGVSGAGQKRIV